MERVLTSLNLRFSGIEQEDSHMMNMVSKEEQSKRNLRKTSSRKKIKRKMRLWVK